MLLLGEISSVVMKYRNKSIKVIEDDNTYTLKIFSPNEEESLAAKRACSEYLCPRTGGSLSTLVREFR